MVAASRNLSTVLAPGGDPPAEVLRTYRAGAATGENWERYDATVRVEDSERVEARRLSLAGCHAVRGAGQALV